MSCMARKTGHRRKSLTISNIKGTDMQDSASYKYTSNLIMACFAGYAQGLQCETCFVLTTIVA